MIQVCLSVIFLVCVCVCAYGCFCFWGGLWCFYSVLLQLLVFFVVVFVCVSGGFEQVGI